MARVVLALAAVAAMGAAVCASTVPQQVHLSLGTSNNERWVSFVTTDALSQPGVRFWPHSASPGSARTATCTQRDYKAGVGYTIYLHECLMANLTLATPYNYSLGDLSVPSSFSASTTYNFTTWQEPYPDLTIAFWGDLGVQNDVSQPYLVKDLQQGGFDMIIHVGDFAYNLEDDNGHRGDAFMNEVQPLAAYVPYQTCLGNHEAGQNFTPYTERFSAVGVQNNGNNWWYSFDVSYIHFVALDSEVYYNADLYFMIPQQLAWLNNDLKNVDRSKTPFIVAFFHRPLYCSNTDDLPDCTQDTQVLRDGFTANGVSYAGLEVPLATYHVNLVLTAHEHSYERTTPVLNGTVQPGLVSPGLLVNPASPMYIVSGAGGCREDLDYYDELHHAAWSYVRSASYGYAKLHIINSTTLFVEQLLSEGKNGTDSFYYVQTQVPTTPRTDLPPLNTAVHKCSSYCLAVCLYSGATAEDVCGRQCRCEKEMATGTLRQVAKDANVQVRMGHLHRH